MQPSIGRVVHYQLSEDDAQLITHRRQTVQGLHGNFAQAGQIYAATVVQVWETNPNGACNLQVHLDGTDTHWATSRTEGTAPGTWAWPART
jgi:hypothetical protein